MRHIIKESYYRFAKFKSHADYRIDKFKIIIIINTYTNDYNSLAR